MYIDLIYKDVYNSMAICLFDKMEIEHAEITRRSFQLSYTFFTHCTYLDPGI